MLRTLRIIVNKSHISATAKKQAPPPPNARLSYLVLNSDRVNGGEKLRNFLCDKKAPQQIVRCLKHLERSVGRSLYKRASRNHFLFCYLPILSFCILISVPTKWSVAYSPSRRLAMRSVYFLYRASGIRLVLMTVLTPLFSLVLRIL